MSESLEKDKSIVDLVERLNLERRKWQILNEWEMDLCAIGFVKQGNNNRWVYVCTYGLEDGRFNYDCDLRSGTSEGSDVMTVESQRNVEYTQLLEAMERYLDAE